MVKPASELQPGEEVSWNWGPDSTPTGKVVSVDETPKTITSKNNTRVTKKGDAENPAVHITTPKGVDVLKRASELNEVDLESTGKSVEEKKAKLGRKEDVVRESEEGGEEDVIDVDGHVVDEEDVEKDQIGKVVEEEDAYESEDITDDVEEEEEESSSENYEANGAKEV
ncbi:hypothetical protein BT69DRAFT_1287235 [Atractiella rhizophila]|nr:hypothetical protein BT69DRAFT_1287235 [Atractiella rhizophila]